MIEILTPFFYKFTGMQENWKNLTLRIQSLFSKDILIIVKMKGRVAIITASSTGIGKSIAEKLAKEGVKVIISSRNIDHVTDTVKQFKEKGYEAYGIVCHVGKKEDRKALVEQTIEKYGRIDYLVPNAAVSLRMTNMMDAEESQLQKMFDINYKSTFMLIKESLPFLRKQQGSSIVLISTLGAYQVPENSSHYAITKLMLVGLAKVLSRVLMKDGIRVNCACPGLIKTDFAKFIWENKTIYDAVQKQIGFKRMGQPEQVASVVKFLLSDEASYVNGEAFVMAGRPSPRL